GFCGGGSRGLARGLARARVSRPGVLGSAGHGLATVEEEEPDAESQEDDERRQHTECDQCALVGRVEALAWSGDPSRRSLVLLPANFDDVGVDHVLAV